MEKNIFWLVSKKKSASYIIKPLHPIRKRNIPSHHGQQEPHPVSPVPGLSLSLSPRSSTRAAGRRTAWSSTSSTSRSSTAGERLTSSPARSPAAGVRAPGVAPHQWSQFNHPIDLLAIDLFELVSHKNIYLYIYLARAKHRKNVKQGCNIEQKPQDRKRVKA